MVPEACVTGQTGFPWEKVSLLIEYEPLKQPLFDQSGSRGAHGGGSKANDQRGKGLSVDQLKLKEYVTLKTAFKPSDTGVFIIKLKNNNKMNIE